jgi:glutathione peroxidase
MRKISFLFASILAILSMAAFVAPPKTFFSFSAKDIIGNETSLSYFKGKTILVVNLATQCGLATQMQELQSLYDKYGEDGLVVLGFPSNSFGQEGSQNADIQLTCTRKYGITFPIFEKIDVKGDDIHPAYKFLTSKSENGKFDAPVEWNFQKFLINKNGNLISSFKSNTSPMDKTIIDAIEKELGLTLAPEPKKDKKAKKDRKDKKRD